MKLFEKFFKKNVNTSTLPTEKCLYEQRFYQTWTDEEENILDKQILKDSKKGSYVNLTIIRVIMPYRSISSIRCKVRERCALLGVKYGTFTK